MPTTKFGFLPRNDKPIDADEMGEGYDHGNGDHFYVRLRVNHSGQEEQRPHHVLHDCREIGRIT